MKVKEWFKTLFGGMAIGVGAAIPGIAGPSIAVILGVYEKIVWAASNVFKKFKEAMRVLIPTLLGMGIAVIPTIIFMKVALANFLFMIICLFGGLILGSLPTSNKEIKGQKATVGRIITFCSCLLIALCLGALTVLFSGSANVGDYFNNPPLWLYFVLVAVGTLSSIGLVVPGISGSMLLLAVGFYKPLINTTIDTLKDCLTGNWNNFGTLLLILISFGIGVIIGFLSFNRLMHNLLNKHHTTTYFGIVGFIVGSIGTLFFNVETYSYYLSWANGENMLIPMWLEITLGSIIFICGGLIAYFVSKKILRK